MDTLEKLPTEVLIYIQNVRKFVAKNKATRDYFKIDSHEEDFFDELTEVSIKNFKETGDAQISIVQFEEIRAKVLKNANVPLGVFQSFGDLGLVSLN